MNNIIIDLSETIYSPKLSYVVIALVIVYFGQLIEASFAKGIREKITTKQRILYHLKLDSDALIMEEKELKEELEQVESIKRLKDEEDETRSNLDGSLDLEWGEESNESGNSDVEEVKKELSEIQNKAEELKLVDEDLKMVEDIIEEGIVENHQFDQKTLQDMKDRIKKLETENDLLKFQIKSLEFQKDEVQEIEEEKDTELIRFLKEHEDDLTLEVLEKALETIKGLKALDKEKSFEDYIEELKNSHVSYTTELAQLRIAKKETEIKLQLLKRRYEEELSSFQEIHVENILKNSGAIEYFERLKERNKIREETYCSLKADLKAKTEELTIWKNKFQDAEKQCSVYWQAWKDTQLKKEELEAERRGLQERDRRLMNQTMNLSSASSLADFQVPPPPPVNVPSIEEILNTASRQSTYSSAQNCPNVRT